MGYQVVPIANVNTERGSASKPLVKGYLQSDIEFTFEDAEEWKKRFQGAGLALCAGKNNVYALDFDVDHSTVAKKLLNMVKKRWPGCLIRHCNPPRFAIIFKAASDLQQLSNGYSSRFRSPEGKFNRIELMGNAAITLYGEHRKTGKPYKWVKKSSPLYVRADELPELSVKDVTEIFDVYDRHLPDGWKKVGESNFRRPRHMTTFENVSLVRRVSEEEIHEALNEVESDDYHTWVDVGMALHNHYNAKKEGLDLWIDWSSRSEKFNGPGECRSKWRTFDTEGGITMGSIIRRVERLKKPGIESLENNALLEHVLRNWVLVEKPNEIADLSRTVGESMLKLKSIRTSAANKFINIEVPTNKSGETLPKRVRLLDVLLSHPDRKIVYDYRYLPSLGRILQGWQIDGVGQLEYYNSYRPPRFEIVEETDLLHFFTDHMEYVFGDNYDMAVNWFAQIMQEPDRKFRVALHSISVNEGTGRGWLVRLFTKLYGGNVKTVGSLYDMFRSGAKNGYLHESVLVTVNEMSCRPEHKYEIMNKLKTMLSDDVQAIDIKYGEQKYDAKIFTRLFGQANGITDVAIDEDDTRFLVCLNENPGKPDSHYERLYDLLKCDRSSDFLNQVYTYLMKWKINYAWMKKAPMTPDKERVIRACKSPTGLAIYDFKILMNGDLFTKSMMEKFLSYRLSTSDMVMGDISYMDTNKEVRYTMKQQFRVNEVTTVKDKRVNVYSFQQHNLFEMGSDKIRQNLIKSRRKIINYIEELN